MSYDLTRQPTPAFEPDPLPGETPSPTVGVHPQSVYERARATGAQYAAQDELAMRKLQEITPRLERPLPSAPITPTKNPNMSALVRSQKDTPVGYIKPLKDFGGPKTISGGVKWEDMTREQSETALSNLSQFTDRPKSAAAPEVTSVEKDVTNPSNPGKPFTGLDWARMMGNMKKRNTDVDVEGENSTGLELPVKKVRKPALPVAIKRAAESVANSHYEKFNPADVAKGIDIKEAHGSALGYFKKTFTETGTNDEIESLVKSNYPHMLPKEMQNPRTETPFAPRVAPKTARSGAAVAKFASNPLSAFSRSKSTKAARNTSFTEGQGK